MSKHTPGPWHISDDEQNVLAKDGTGNRLIAQCHAGHLPERSANARLIAAAPDLLATLRRLVEVLECDQCTEVRGWEEYDDARTAIAKASESGSES